MQEDSQLAMRAAIRKSAGDTVDGEHCHSQCVSLWQQFISRFWAIVFSLLVGKCLPRLSPHSPPCTQATASSAIARTTEQPLEISIPMAFEGANVLLTGQPYM